MKRIICIIGLSLFLTGCSSSFMGLEDNNGIQRDKLDSEVDGNEKTTYVDEDTKKVILNINSLREKYKNSMNEDQYEYESPYIDLQNPGIKEVSFDNEMFNDKDYFKELIEILDKSVSKGLKEHIQDMKIEGIEDNEIVLRKIGRTVVYTENRDGDRNNYISITVDFSDIKDEDYKALFDEISDNKYILDNLVGGGKLNMLDFINLDTFYDRSGYSDNYLSVRYNIFLEEKDIKKVNILMKAKNETHIKDDDIDVFTNLLKALEIFGKEEDLLLKEYKDVFRRKSKKREIALEDYKVLIDSEKGSSYSSSDEKLVYFSLEKIK